MDYMCWSCYNKDCAIDEKDCSCRCHDKSGGQGSRVGDIDYG